MPSSSEPNNQAKILFIINEGSGNKDTDWEKLISEFYEDKNRDIELFKLPKEFDTQLVKEKIRELKPDQVVAVGGDGTVKLVASCIIDTKIILGILPAGSANGMAKELGIPVDPLKALDTIHNCAARSIHLVRINDELCMHLSDIGFNALVVKKFESERKRGMWTYIKSAWKVLWEHSLMQVNIKAGDEYFRREAAMLVIANATKYGSGALINPEGKLDDDLFELVIVKRVAFSELFKMLVTHRPYDTEKVEVFQTRHVEIRSRKKAHFQVDGEYLGKVDLIDATIIPNALKILVNSSEALDNV